MGAPEGYEEVSPDALPPPMREKLKRDADWYARLVGPPTRALTAGLQAVEPTALQNFRYRPPIVGGLTGTISGKPSDVAQTVIPQDKLTAILTATGFAMPWLKELPWLAPLLKSRMGRIVATTGVGALEQKLEGKSALGGAGAGLLTAAPAEAGSALTQRLTEGNEAARYTRGIGQTIESEFPWIKKALDKAHLKSGANFDAAIKSGDLDQGLREILAGEKQSINAQVRFQSLGRSGAFDALIRDNPDEAADLKIKPFQQLNFDKADQFITRVRQKAYSLRGGDPKDAALAARIRFNADRALDDLKFKLNNKVPGLGNKYRAAQQSFWESKNIADLIKEPGVIEDGAINAEKAQGLAREQGGKGYRRELEATPAGRKLLSKIFRGGSPATTDQPRFGMRVHAGPISVHANLFGTRRAGTVPQKLYAGLPYAVAEKLFGAKLNPDIDDEAP